MARKISFINYKGGVGKTSLIVNQDIAGACGLASNDSDAIQKITDAIQHVAQQRATRGAVQSRR